MNVISKEERRKIVRLMEFGAKPVNLGIQLESLFVKPEEVRKIGTEYERVQKEIDAKLSEWERMQIAS